jgi:uncharacterized protein YfaS (alpha-2-macroglobulin family)
MNRSTRVFSLFVVFSLLTSTVAPLAVIGRSLTSKPPREQDQSRIDSERHQAGLRFRLSQAPDQPETKPRSKVTASTVLSEYETANILKRMAPINAEDPDEQEFALRERGLSPPRTGNTIKVAFPGPEGVVPSTTASDPLEVLRYSPEGDVPLAPQLAITFSRSMVALSSQEEAAANVPVELSPQPPGKWRWLGTRTLVFEPTGRFPMATQYSVTVPAGTKSAGGGTLANPKSWTFTTPTPTIVHSYPGKEHTQARDTLMFIAFDQRIDPAAMINSIQVRSGGRLLSVRLATKEEIGANFEVKQLVEATQNDRWLAFRVVNPQTGENKLALPAGANITVEVAAGAPSLEGPLRTRAAQQFSFTTYGPLHVTRSLCGYQDRCRPNEATQIWFNNRLNAAAFNESQILVVPAMPGLKVSIFNESIIISGLRKANTRYTVTFGKALRDIFGQTLEREETVSFNVAMSSPVLALSVDGMAVLDPAGPRSVSLYSINYQQVRISLYGVGPEDWISFLAYRRERYYEGSAAVKKTPLPGRLITTKVVDLKSSADEIAETLIDLTPGLHDGLGQVLVAVESIMPASDGNHDPLLAWVQLTNIGLDAIADNDELLGWASSLVDGAPLSGVQLQILPSGLAGVTVSDGTAHLTFRPYKESPPSVLVARRGNDVAFLPEAPDWGILPGTYWHKVPWDDELRWYVFDDRKLYRPGEEVHLKGWLRRIGRNRGGDVGLLTGPPLKLNYSVTDDSDNEVTKGDVTLNAFGGFDTAFKLPANINLGSATVEFETANDEGDFHDKKYEHRFTVQEFRRPEFEVTASRDNEGELFPGNHADISVMANYFAGGGLSDAEVKWEVSSQAINFTPPNRSDYTFGVWTPWWEGFGGSGPEVTKEFAGKTDQNGKHRLRVDFGSVNPPRPSVVVAQASVTDVNRQSWTATTSMLVHPADLYVGLKSDRLFVKQGEPLAIHSIVTDLDGKIIVNREIKMRAVRLDWRQLQSEWTQVEVEPQDCTIKSAAADAKCAFKKTQGGVYHVTATIRDDRGRANESTLTLWVDGGKLPAQRGVDQEKVQLIPDRREYKAGDTAEVLVQAPFYPAEAVMTLRRSGVLESRRFKMDGPTYTLRVPIQESWTPNVHVQVDLIGAVDRSDETANVSPKRPAFASGEISLTIPPSTRRLMLVATPRSKTMLPGEQTVVDVEVKDAEGKPVANSEVALVIVDESVLALTDYKIVDPVTAFYSVREGGANDYHSRKSLVLANPKLLAEEREQFIRLYWARNVGGNEINASVSMVGGNITEPPLSSRNFANLLSLMPGVTAPASKNQVRLRENFNALAVFAPSVRTAVNGHARVRVKLPDNLTRYRVMAVAVAGGKQFGTGESAITARLPLMARPSAPRFLNFGDRFELPIVVQNQTNTTISADVVVRATNAQLFNETAGVSPGVPLKALTSAGRRVVVPANDRVEVRIPATTVKAGIARFQIAAISGRWSDAAEISLPVWTPATTEAFATYGEIDEGSVAQPVQVPQNVFPQFGGLEVETSSTQLQELTDAVLYLVNYSYGCAEQRASRIIAIAALRDVLTAFKAKDFPSPSELESKVADDLKALQGMQNDDGGFGFWKRGEQSWPYLSLHVAHALARAKQKGFAVPEEMFENSRKYLAAIESNIPAQYSAATRQAIIAYSLYVRAQMGERDPSRARQLIAEAGLEKLSLESVGWLLSVLTNDKESAGEVNAIRRLLNNRVTESAGTAHFVCSYNDDDYLILNSNGRADGIVLEALIGDQPKNDLIPKLVRGLLAHRIKGRWENTQENVFTLLALDRYFNTFEKVTPNFVAQVWLGSVYAGAQDFKGRSTDRQLVNVPMRYLIENIRKQQPEASSPGDVTGNLIVSKEGQGRLYYRIGMNYAPADLNLKAAEYGFTVGRTYEAIDDPGDVTRDAEGVWHIKAGSRVRVRLSLVAPARRYHVALTDPLPAGFESLNPVLAMTERIPEDASDESYGSRQRQSLWFDHQNLRDERTEAFTSLLWEGVYDYSYVARATTPGSFVVPPTKAEEMYHPETFGRGQTDRVRIE